MKGLRVREAMGFSTAALGAKKAMEKCLQNAGKNDFQVEILYLAKLSPSMPLDEDLFRCARIILICLPCTFSREAAGDKETKNRKDVGSGKQGSNPRERKRGIPGQQ